MKCAYIERYGGAVLFGEQARPRPGTGEVLVQVHAASVNPIDCRIREGKARAILPSAMPLVLGSDFSGVVVELGPAATGFALGDEVFGRLPLHQVGSFAEYVRCATVCLAHKPAGIGFTQAAAVPLAALTAWQALFEHGKVGRGQRVLIHGGAGGVGLFAIELAHLAGAWVATTSNATQLERVREHGADLAIDYRNQRFEELASAVDFVLDTQGGEVRARSWGCLRTAGMMVSVAGLPDAAAARRLGLGWPARWLLHSAHIGTRRLARRHGVHFHYLFMQPCGEQLAQIARAIDRGGVRPLVDRTFALADAGQAMAWSEQGRRAGKVVIEVRQADA